ncbi:Protein FAM117A [Oryzias melastigma]|uniref:Protein FAM117A n=1 Tax=Oryzias melastigma TaxID=30732 RepID=A0A834CSN8_ORYME|nr:Protein FAM117A [Oryzias melastigma]
MSGRSGQAGRPAASGLLPLKATVPFRLASKPRPTSRRDGKSAGKPKSHQLSSGMRRTMSLDAIVGPYLQGHWPKELEGPSSQPRKNKSTQTPDSWVEKSHSRNGNIHKRSASWGSAEHLREISKLKQHLQQCGKPAVSGGHEKDRQGTYPHGSCSLGATQNVAVKHLNRTKNVCFVRISRFPSPSLPLSTLVPPLRCSVEGLNQELEGMFISQPLLPQHRASITYTPPSTHFLEIPDGHRAPIPSNGSSSGSHSDRTITPISPSSTSSSPFSSPSYVCTSLSSSVDTYLDTQQEGKEMCLLSPSSSLNEAEPSLPLAISSSPGPNKSCCFQREPPEGCEKVKVWEEISVPLQSKPALVSSCPDPNKVNFTPHGGSAFCPVSLLKPLLPSMDLLFRSLAVSPTGSCSSQGTGSYQAASSGNRASPSDPSVGGAVVGESSGEGLAF